MTLCIYASIILINNIDIDIEPGHKISVDGMWCCHSIVVIIAYAAILLSWSYIYMSKGHNIVIFTINISINQLFDSPINDAKLLSKFSDGVSILKEI